MANITKAKQDAVSDDEKPKRERVQIPVRMDPELRSLVSVYAGEDQTSANEFIVKAIENEVDRRFGDDWTALEARYAAMKPRVDEIRRRTAAPG